MHTSVTGIVTRYVDYKENDRIITIFSREQGRVDARARGCRKAKSPLLPACQPFVFGEFQLFTQKEDKAVVDQCDIRENFYHIREDVQRLSAGAGMLSLTQEAIQPGEPNDRLFSLLYYCLSFLCYSDTPAIDLALCFMIRYLDVIGFCPAITECALCGRDLRSLGAISFSAKHGGAVCRTCGFGAKSVSPLAMEALRRMLLLEDAAMRSVRLPKPVRKELVELLSQYCSHVLERENKAIGILRQLAAKECV